MLDDRLHSELGKPSQVDFVEMPPRDVFLYLSALHGVTIVVDPKVDPDGKMAITANYEGIDLASLLLLLTAPHNLGCDYRYGALWITTPDDCAGWHDPTGIEKIKPPPGSALARAWLEPIGVDFNRPTPLKPTMASIEEKMGISIDTSSVPDAESHSPASSMPRGPWTPNPAATGGTIHGRQLRHVLGHLLYTCGYSCRLEGDKLVIVPPE